MKKIILLFGLVTIIGNAYSQVPENLTDEAKIYGLSKVWKEADKNFVFFDQVPSLDWDKTYQAYISKVLETKSTYDYYKKLQEFCALLNDGHTKVYVPWQLREVKEVATPIKTELIGNQVIITEILNDTIKNQGLKKGMEIIEIDGVPIHEYASNKVKPYVSYSTEQDMNVQVYEYNLLKGNIEEKIKLKTKNGKVYPVSRKLIKPESDTPTFEFRKLNEEIGYLKISRFWGDNLKAKFDSIFQNIQSMPKLIIDVSENQGGSNGYSNYVLSHFVDKPFMTSRWKTLMYMPAWVSNGFNTQWQDNEGNIVQPKEASKRYTKPVVVLISEKTYSAAEDFISAFLNTERGVVIGRPTAGTTGNPIGFQLPGKGAFQICSKRDYLSNGKEFVGYGISPQIEVKKVIDENHLINKGIEILKKEN
ncbi:S41 family peptidase [Winogradskyella flava]|uniref:S41 family peptidase n=1 Tax=Winogradskyella flava TaxID=1884876 RepID=UPI00249221EC|nr:S41 family peptidase [Winogradskyella flava]